MGGPRGGQMGDGVGGVGVHHHGGGDALEELLGPFPVVRLRGLPFEAQVRDVILFFQVRTSRRPPSVKSTSSRARRAFHLCGRPPLCPSIGPLIDPHTAHKHNRASACWTWC